MGVHRDFRQRGLGRRLLAYLENWAKAKTSIEYIDLWVLASNKQALHLYYTSGYQQTGKVEDMFRIDGASLSSITMSKRLS